jgi:hypothetical protein
MLKAVEGRTTSQDELPIWIEHLLTLDLYSCSEPGVAQFRQECLRERVWEAVDAYENGRNQLHDACVQHLADPDDDVVENALACLFVIGTSADMQAVEALFQHPSEIIRKAARTCRFEIRRRPGEM